MGLTNKLNVLKYMFYGCEKLESVDFSDCDFSSVYNMYGMFAKCSALKPLISAAAN